MLNFLLPLAHIHSFSRSAGVWAPSFSLPMTSILTFRFNTALPSNVLLTNCIFLLLDLATSLIMLRDDAE